MDKLKSISKGLVQFLYEFFFYLLINILFFSLLMFFGNLYLLKKGYDVTFKIEEDRSLSIFVKEVNKNE